MATTTTNMALTKPATTDAVNIGDINGNMDTLDAHDHTGGTKGVPAKMVLSGLLSSRPAAVTAGQLYVANDDGPSLHIANGSVWAKLNATKIAEVVLTAAAATIDFLSIPGTYRHLELVLYARGDSASTLYSVNLRFNGDTGANYDSERSTINAAAGNFVESFGVTLVRAGVMPGGGAAANLFGTISVRIGHYANTANTKSFHSQCSTKIGTASGNVYNETNAGHWRSTAAINRITVINASSNLVAGTMASLYGLP